MKNRDLIGICKCYYLCEAYYRQFNYYPVDVVLGIVDQYSEFDAETEIIEFEYEELRASKNLWKVL